MKWRLEFYHEKRGILARYDVEASSPAAAVESGRHTMLAEHPATPARRRLSLLERAERAAGHDRSGWVLYRITETDGPASPRVVPAPTT